MMIICHQRKGRLESNNNLHRLKASLTRPGNSFYSSYQRPASDCSVKTTDCFACSLLWGTDTYQSKRHTQKVDFEKNIWQSMKQKVASFLFFEKGPNPIRKFWNSFEICSLKVVVCHKSVWGDGRPSVDTSNLECSAKDPSRILLDQDGEMKCSNLSPIRGYRHKKTINSTSTLDLIKLIYIHEQLLWNRKKLPRHGPPLM